MRRALDVNKINSSSENTVIEEVAMGTKGIVLGLVAAAFSAVLIAGQRNRALDGHGQCNHDHHKKTKAAAPASAEMVAQKTCPVMGGEIDSSFFVDHEGKRVYFCCEACIETFNESPDKYLEKMATMGEKPARLENQSLAPQKTCPVMGGVINRELFADYQGQRVFFCCAGCKAPFEEEPEKYLGKLAEMGEAPETITASEKKG